MREGRAGEHYDRWPYIQLPLVLHFLVGMLEDGSLSTDYWIKSTFKRRYCTTDTRLTSGYVSGPLKD